MNEIYITLHLEATTEEALSMATLEAQVFWKMNLDFFDFSQKRNGRFICWFKVPQSSYIERRANGRT